MDDKQTAFHVQAIQNLPWAHDKQTALKICGYNEVLTNSKLNLQM
jgi:hypothetical protein